MFINVRKLKRKEKIYFENHSVLELFCVADLSKMSDLTFQLLTKESLISHQI